MNTISKISITKLFATAGIFIALLLVVAFIDQFSQKNSIESGADKIIALCKDASYRPTCYDLEIPKLMGALSMEDTFKVTRIIQDKESNYPYCHVLGHLIGGVETAKDPSKWKDVAGRCPTDMCSNGCMHGVFQERFRSESLPEAPVTEVSSILSGICEPRDGFNPTSLVQATCTHALGHLTMYVTGADIRKSLSICDRISINKDGHDFRPLCYDGVFMQLFQPLEPEDFALVEGKVPSKDKVEKFCSAFSGEERNSCWSESWPLVKAELKHDPLRVEQFCAQLAQTDGASGCMRDMFYILAVQFGLDSNRIEKYCAQGTHAIRGECFAAAASRFIEVDARNVEKALALCQSAEHYGVGDVCYVKLAQDASYDFKEGSKAFTQLCGGLPAQWQDQCYQQPR